MKNHLIKLFKINNEERVWILALIVLFVLSSFLRFETAVGRPLWPDEKITLSSANMPTLGELYQFSINTYRGDTPFLYPVLCWMIASIASPEWTVRLFSVISGVIATLLLAQLCSLIISKRIGFYAGALFAFCSYHIEYSQDGRSYSFFILTLVAEYFFLISFLKHKNNNYLLGFIIASISSLYSHNCALVFLLTGLLATTLHLCNSIFLKHKKINIAAHKSILIPLILSYLTILVLYLPGLSIYLKFIEQYRTGDTHVLNLSWHLIFELFGRWGNGAQWSWLYLCLLILGCINLLKKELGFAIIIWFSTSFLVFTLIPFNKLFFDIRNLIGSLPAFFLIIASGISLFADLTVKFFRYGNSFSNQWLNKNNRSIYAELLVFTLLISLSISTYQVFRKTEQKCSMFPYQPEVMLANDGFCKKHIILNSLYEEHRFILK